MKRITNPLKLRFLFPVARILAISVSATLASTGRAAEVTGDMALAAAGSWAAENRSLSGGIGTPVSVKERRDDDGKLLWYEVATSGGGCVVASADTEIEPVVAVLDDYDGEIPPGHPLEAMLLADMRRRLDVLGGNGVSRKGSATARTSSASVSRNAGVETSAANASRKWSKLTDGAHENARVRALSKSSAEATTPTTIVRYLPDWASKRLTHWNQFDTYTPNHYPAGCVATAGAALLQFFNVTAAPKVTNTCTVDGASRSLTTKGIDYDWSILPEENASYGSFSSAQKDLVDRAVYDMGVCLGMNYKSGGSGAGMSKLAEVLRTQYGFSDARFIWSLEASSYEKLIYAQIRAGAPVGLSIWNGRDGHAVLAVGYGVDADETEYTRVFMGWGGSHDAWYALPNVDDFTVLDGVVTMIGATSDTLAMRGRVTTASGKGAAYVDVTVGGKTVETDENGYWGVRVTPVAGTLSCSCGGTAKSATVGAKAVDAGSEWFSGSALASALPDPVDFTVPDTAALVVYTSPSAAVRAALREGKILMVLVGYDGCQYCEKLKAQIKAMGTAFSSDFVLFYANTQINAYGLDDETYTGSPYWGTFDPRVWKVENRWAADNGRFTISQGYSSSGTTSNLNSARSQWAQRNAAPSSLAVVAPDQITMPTALAARVSFPDGTEAVVRDGLTWNVVSGTAATIMGGDILSPVEGASGDVTVRCEGRFWNAPYTATKTIRVIDGVVATGLEIDGPATIDLYSADGAQFTAQAVLSDGSRVEVPVRWDVVEAKSTNCTMSASGYLSFRKDAYSRESSVRVTARYMDYSASAELTVWGASVKVHTYTLSDQCAWPGKTVTLTIDKVRWWRHGGWEEPTDDFTGVGVYWYGYAGNTYLRGADVTSRTFSIAIPADITSGDSYLDLYVQTYGKVSGSELGGSWFYPTLQYVPAAPSRMVAVTFDGNGGEPAMQTAEYAVGYPYGGFPVVSKTGYSCDWYTAAEGGTSMTTASNCVASVTRLHARWSANHYYVSYDSNGGTGSMSGQYFYYDRPASLRTNAFTRPGYVFAGWATAPDGEVVFEDEAAILNLYDSYHSLKLYAKWVENGYRISFDANGGVGTMPSQICRVGTCSSLASATFTRRGATFAGWSRIPDGAAEFSDRAEVCNLTTTVGSTVTLYAVWNLPAVKTIELTGPDVIDLYDVESAQFSAVCRLANGTAVDVAPKWVIEETAVTNAVVSTDGLISFPDPTKYTKASKLRVTADCNGVRASRMVDVWGWRASLSSWTTPRRVVWPGQAIQVVPLAVTWWRHGVTENPTTDFSGVTFGFYYGYINGNTYLSATSATSGPDGLSLVLPEGLSEPEGRCYMGVKTDAMRHGKTVSSYLYPYFKFLPSAPAQTVSVTFEANGGEPATQTMEYAAGYTYGYLPEAVRKGYSYGGWYTAAAGGTPISTESTCDASQTRLYARWSPRYYYIDYDSNGGTGTMYGQYFYYDDPANLTANAFTKVGHTFGGWSMEPGGVAVFKDKAAILNLASVYTNITLYAAWTPATYTVTLNAQNGTAAPPPPPRPTAPPCPPSRCRPAPGTRSAATTPRPTVAAPCTTPPPESPPAPGTRPQPRPSTPNGRPTPTPSRSIGKAEPADPPRPPRPTVPPCRPSRFRRGPAIRLRATIPEKEAPGRSIIRPRGPASAHGTSTARRRSTPSGRPKPTP